MPYILVIDDDPTIQTLLKRSLVRCGYQVAMASNGEDGLQAALKLIPALVICDWVMPGMSGLEVCQKVKSTPTLSTTYFLLLTALDSIEDRIQGLEAGADDFLSKPVQMNELIARVKAGLRLHQLSQDLHQQKQLLETELAEAADYVCSILPEPMNEPSVAINTRFIPSRRLGGDSFDYYWLDHEHLVLYLLDVAGHGLRAALPSLSVINLLRNQNLNHVDYRQPWEVLQGLNRIFQMTERNDKYFTIWYGVYNSRQQRLLYSSAGHPPAILLCLDAELEWVEQRLSTPGLPIGMFPNTPYENAVAHIQEPSVLYVFSDGIYEIDRTEGGVLGLESFLKLITKQHHRSELMLERLFWHLKAEHPRATFEDDVSIMQVLFGDADFRTQCQSPTPENRH